MRDYAYFSSMTWKTRLLNSFRGIFRLPMLERWLRDRTNGNDPRSIWGRMIPPEYVYPKGSWRNLERDGLKYHLDLSNATDHGAYFGVLDVADENLKARIQPDHTVIDIGGNIGIYAMLFARRASRGRVISFEPDPVNFARLSEHISMNALGNVQALQLGIGPEERTHRLYQVVESNSGMNRIITGVDVADRFPSKEVRVAPLRVAFEGLSVSKVDVIKIDVEGFEEAVLRGSEDIIRRDMPTMFIELDDRNPKENNSSARSVVGYIGTMGYQVLDATTREVISAERELTDCEFDVLCIPAGRPAA